MTKRLNAFVFRGLESLKLREASLPLFMMKKLSILLLFFLLTNYTPVVLAEESDSLYFDKLKKEKLREEINQIQIRNKREKSIWFLLSQFSGPITVLIAFIGTIITVWKILLEQSAQKKKDNLIRENEAKTRQEEFFTLLTNNLGESSESKQASSAISLMGFLSEELKSYHERVFYIYLANLKIIQSETVNKLLIKGFEKAIRKFIQLKKDAEETYELDLTHTNLHRIDLSNLDLSHADLAYSKFNGAIFKNSDLSNAKAYNTNFQGAVFSNANLREVRMQKCLFDDAVFHNAILTSGKFQHSVFVNTEFQKAKLQSAHLDDCKISGSKFEESNVSDTFFTGASISEDSKKSLLNASQWTNVNPGEFRKELEKIK